MQLHWPKDIPSSCQYLPGYAKYRRHRRFLSKLYILLAKGKESGNSVQIEANWRGAMSINNHALVGIASFETVNDDAELNIHIAELGGFLNLSGYHKRALVGRLLPSVR